MIRNKQIKELANRLLKNKRELNTEEFNRLLDYNSNTEYITLKNFSRRLKGCTYSLDIEEDNHININECIEELAQSSKWWLTRADEYIQYNLTTMKDLNTYIKIFKTMIDIDIYSNIVLFSDFLTNVEMTKAKKMINRLEIIQKLYYRLRAKELRENK